MVPCSHSISKLLALVSVVSISLIAATPVAAEKPGVGPVTIVERARFGGYIEEAAYIPFGPHANHIAVSNGYQVLGVPRNANSDSSIKELYDSFDVPYDVAPKGMAFIESEGTMAYCEGGTPESLFISDLQGNPLPTRPITYTPVPLDSLHNEGLSYVPQSYPIYPDHLLMIANRFPDAPPFQLTTVEVIRLDGVVVEQIQLDEPIQSNYATGLAIKGPNEILVGMFNTIYSVDFEGHILGDPVEVPVGNYIEGLEVLPDGQVVVTAGKNVYFLDSNLQIIPTRTRDFGIGAGIYWIGNNFWNDDTQQHVIASNTEESGDYFNVDAFRSLDGLERVASVTPYDPWDAFRTFDCDYIPSEDATVALLLPFFGLPPEIVLYDQSGNELQRTILPPLGGTAIALNYIEHTDQFAIRCQGAAFDHKIRIVSRAGVLVRNIDLLPGGVESIYDMASFDPEHPSGGRFVVMARDSSFGRSAFVVDFDGNVLSHFDYTEELHARFPTGIDAITTGPNAGAFVVGEAFNHELIVFRLSGE